MGKKASRQRGGGEKDHGTDCPEIRGGGAVKRIMGLTAQEQKERAVPDAS